MCTQGDGISFKSLGAILENMEKNGWAADNLAFGSGGALLQKLNRDTLKCAFKCSSIVINGQEREVYKAPVTDPGKKSKKGRLTLEKRAYPKDQAEMESAGVFGAHQPELVGTEQILTICEGKGDAAKDMLVEVYKDGVLLVDQKFADIRKRADVDGGPFGGGSA